MSVATKVAVQMNAKLGGEPWAVKIPMKDTMIIGYVSCWSCSHCLEFHCHSSFRTLTMIRCTKGSRSEQSWPAWTAPSLSLCKYCIERNLKTCSHVWKTYCQVQGADPLVATAGVGGSDVPRHRQGSEEVQPSEWIAAVKDHHVQVLDNTGRTFSVSSFEVQTVCVISFSGNANVVFLGMVSAMDKSPISWNMRLRPSRGHLRRLAWPRKPWSLSTSWLARGSTLASSRWTGKLQAILQGKISNISIYHSAFSTK